MININKQTLVIDARPLTRGTGGIQLYLRKLLPYILESNDYQVVMYSDKPLSLTDQKKFNGAEIRVIDKGILSTIAWYWFVPRWLRLDQASIYWSPRHHLPLFTPKDCIKVVTIHDFVWKTTPHTMPFLQRLSERILMPIAISKSDMLICISNTTQKQLLDFFPTKKNNSCVILHGNDPVKVVKAKDSSNTGTYFLAVGTLEPRKNYIRLIKAFDLYIKKGGEKNLLIVGKKGWEFDGIFSQLEQSKNRKRITIQTNTTDQQLNSLYQNAYGFISSSIDEGYGLPPQEANQHGLRLALSNIDVYRELYQYADIWMDPLSCEHMADAILSLDRLCMKSSKTTPVSIKSWESCAQELRHCFSTFSD